MMGRSLHSNALASRLGVHYPWRGRAWGPLHLLTWMGLRHERYAASPLVAATRRGLVQQALDLLLGEFREARRVHENYNSTTGRGGDVVNSNPFYHWGANLGCAGAWRLGWE